MTVFQPAEESKQKSGMGEGVGVEEGRIITDSFERRAKISLGKFLLLVVWIIFPWIAGRPTCTNCY